MEANTSPRIQEFRYAKIRLGKRPVFASEVMEFSKFTVCGLVMMSGFCRRDIVW